MLQSNKLEIYPTSRAIRERVKEALSQNTLLPKTITIGEFEKKALIVPGRTFVDEEHKTLLMQEASRFDNFRKLQIDREFFTFIKNSSYLFSFFEELAVEQVTIETLKLSDYYADYTEHLEILATLRQNYIDLLDAKNLVDKMTLPALYKLNRNYIASFSQIDLFLEGYLNRFELRLIEEIAAITPLMIHLHAIPFNRKMLDAFNLLGFDLKPGYDYLLDIEKRSVLKAVPITAPATRYHVTSVDNRVEEIAFIKQALYRFIEQGYAPEEIIVLLPKASQQQLLDLFDDENNFNFAMGFPFTDDPIYRRLDALYRYYTDKSYENRFRLTTLGYTIEEVDELQKVWSQKHTPAQITQMLTSLVPAAKSDAFTIYEEQLHLFSRLLPTVAHYPFHKVLHLFLNRLSTATIDDVRGGKITVMEILETRGIRKKALIVTDFNEGVLPSQSKKDLFLSTAIRSASGLPTPQDRQNLQKYYYRRIFDQADEVAICYIEDDQNRPSRFLQELGIDNRGDKDPHLRRILFPPTSPRAHYSQEELILPYDFTQHPLSASALRTFLDCRRKYYFAYIRKLREFEIPKEANDDRAIGTILHEALQEVYSGHDHFTDEDALFYALQRALYKRSEKSASLQFLTDVWLQKLKPFIAHEIRRFHEGVRIHSVERKETRSYEGLTLTGEIDRIDTYHDTLLILDYKSGKIPTTPKEIAKSSDFQLQFYTLLGEEIGEVADARYYDLGSGTLTPDKRFDDKMALLHEHFDMLRTEKEFNFTMTDALQKCTWCPYQKICNRIM